MKESVLSKETIVILRDDLDNSEATETVTFSYRGKDYEIDLNEKHIAALDKAMSRYVGAARQVGAVRAARRGGAPRKAASGSKATKRNDLAEIREWARSNGYEVSDRGRIPVAIVEAFEAH